MAGAVLVGILMGLFIQISLDNATVVEAKNEVVVEQPQEVRIEVVWSKDEIEKEIRRVFHEEPNTAVAVAKCESGLIADIQSQHKQSYGQERSFGLFQAHEPDWGHVAKELELTKWKTDVVENIQLARHIYDVSGKSFRPWSCFTKKMI